MKRSLLLNPPGSRPFSRDYYLGGESEAGMSLPPQDLVSLTAALSPRGPLEVLDALAEGLDAGATLERARAFAPDAVFFLSSGTSYAEDKAFLPELRRALPKARLTGLGDLYRDIRELAFPLQPFLDAVLLDFASEESLALLDEGKPAPNIIFRSSQGELVCGPARRRLGRWESGTPRWDLFPLERYRLPFGEGKKGATLLTDYGCPYLCTYCPMSAAGFRLRPVDAVMEEVSVLKGLGVSHLLLRDQSFGADRPRTLELLSRLTGQRLTWTASTRVDLVDASLLAAMKRAGCVAVNFGVDSLDDELMRAYKKNTTAAQAKAALSLTREAGLKTWGTAVIGLSLETRETLEASLSAIRALPWDRLSFRVESQRYASEYRRDMLVQGLVPPEAMPPDTPTTTSVWQGRLGVSNPDAFEYHRRAVEDASPASRGRA